MPDSGRAAPRGSGVPPPIVVESIEDLKRLQDRIVERLNASPNGGRLFLSDPLRCLAELHVEIAPAALDAWKALAAPDVFDGDGSGAGFAQIRDSAIDQPVRVTIRGLLPPRRPR